MLQAILRKLLLLWRIDISVDEVKALEECIRVVFHIVSHDELDEICPNLEVAILISIDSAVWLVELVGESNHLIESTHEIRCVVTV